VKLKHWDWDAQNFAVVDYPEEMFADMLDWLLLSKQWWLPKGLELVQDKVIKLQQRLGEYRVQHPEAIIRPWNPTQTVGTTPVTTPAPLIDPAKARRLAGLEKGRETLRRRREAAHASR